MFLAQKYSGRIRIRIQIRPGREGEGGKGRIEKKGKVMRTWRDIPLPPPPTPYLVNPFKGRGKGGKG
jgi:hypothetical protein